MSRTAWVPTLCGPFIGALVLQLGVDEGAAAAARCPLLLDLGW